MDKFVINGPCKIKGQSKIEGSKNAALPIMAAALLVAKGESIIKNIPPLRDINTMVEVLRHLGAKVEYDKKKQVMAIDASALSECTAPYELMSKMRASFLVLGPLMARLGEARISLPGGCSLGARPVDFHIKAFQQMGAKVKEQAGYIIAKGKPLIGTQLYFDRPSHTGTENLLYGAVFAKGRTTITNAACDPEVVDVANFLNLAGAKISGAGTPTIVIDPVKKLNPIEYSVCGDRLVAGTLMFAAAITGGEVDLTHLDPNDLTMVNMKLIEMGCKIKTRKRGLWLKAPKKLAPIRMTTFPYPGFPTDLQACLMATACKAEGTSHIQETVYADRFSHTMELRRLGAKIEVNNAEAVIQGVSKFSGAQVMAPDIRAGAGITIACLAAAGRSDIMRVYHIDRGYNHLEEKLSALGADIIREQA